MNFNNSEKINGANNTYTMNITDEIIRDLT